jgi:signal transduction histidine kinase
MKIKDEISRLVFSEELSFEKRKVNLLFLCSSVVMIFVLLVRIADRTPLPALITTALLVISAFMMLWLNNHYHIDNIGGWIVMIWAGDILFPINYVVIGGMESDVAAWLCFPIIICSLICRGKSFWILLPTYIAIAMICLWVNYQYPESFQPLDINQRYVEIVVTILAVGLTSGAAIKFQGWLYERERTKTAEATRALNESRENELTAARAKTNFLANMSHEMRTPMNAIIGMTTIAEMTDDAAQKEKCLKTIHESSDHLNRLINDILEMANTDTGKAALAVEPFDFRLMMANVIENFNPQIEKKEQGLHFQIDPDIPQTLSGDASKLSSLLTYLISNAVKFTPNGGSIDIRVQKQKEDGDLFTLRVDVADTGIGIADDQMERIFLPFEQGESDLNRKYGGSGLGLAFSRRIVESMNGRLWVESKLGEGATFSFTIDLAV